MKAAIWKACGCGARKRQADLVCRGCWRALPPELQRRWDLARRQGRDFALPVAREIARFARTRRPAPQPQPVQQPLL